MLPLVTKEHLQLRVSSGFNLSSDNHLLSADNHFLDNAEEDNPFFPGIIVF